MKLFSAGHERARFPVVLGFDDWKPREELTRGSKEKEEA